jgi:type VI secretion system protein ImpG
VLARELKAGEIRNLTSNSQIPEFVRFANLTQPTLILFPPLQEGLEWRFISHLALNYLSLTNVEALRSILELYNWSKERGVREANHRRISSIINVRVEPGEIPYQGSVLRGIDVTLEVVRENFEDDGDIHLFGSVMKEFLGLYVSINSFVKLKIVSYQTKEELFEWVPEIMNDRNRESLMRRRHLPL